MQDNKKSPSQPGSEKNIDPASLPEAENQRLIRENIELRKSLESEQFLHSNLYKEWKQLKEISAAKEAELQRYKQGPWRGISRSAFKWLLLITLL